MQINVCFLHPADHSPMIRQSIRPAPIHCRLVRRQAEFGSGTRSGRVADPVAPVGEFYVKRMQP
jgi:hypothetical protein